MKPIITDSWIRNYLQPQHPELVAPYKECVSLYETARTTGALPQEAIATLLVHAKNSRTVLSENVSTMIGQLADRFEEARDVIRQMSSDKKLHIRVNALVALASHAPSQLHFDLLATMLGDRSIRVRDLATDRIMSFGILELLPHVEAAITHESNPKQKAILEWYRDLLSLGYHIKANDDGSASITCRTESGVVTGYFQLDEMETKGKEWIEKNAKPGLTRRANA